jgi:uncharacterized membrane protein
MGLKLFRIRDFFSRNDGNNDMEMTAKTNTAAGSDGGSSSSSVGGSNSGGFGTDSRNDGPNLHVTHGHVAISNVVVDAGDDPDHALTQERLEKSPPSFVHGQSQHDHQRNRDRQQRQRQQHHRTNDHPTADHETVYELYMREIIPAIVASFPILITRLWQDALHWLMGATHDLYLFILPTWMRENAKFETMQQQLLQQQEHAQQLWEQAIESSKNLTIAEFLKNHFDTNDDGHISASELMNFTESIMSRMPTLTALRTTAGDVGGGIGTMKSLSFLSFISREWPLMDWKIGRLLWHTFGGLLLVVAVLSIIPGRLHSWSAKILRWPVLALTYLLISVELVVYIMIRLGIRIVEYFFQTPKHRQLRRKMASAKTYEEWYSYAAALDISQKRDVWQKTVDDEDAFQYNWPLIRQLMVDMEEARDRNDPIQAMAVMQQCSRKNAGGVMSEDLFTKTYTGEPKVNTIGSILLWS